MEHHPRLNKENLRIEHFKIILGSFPIWSLTQKENNEKKQIHSISASEGKKGEFPFFYGSSTNQFWAWYQQYIDSEIILMNAKNIQSSLEKNKIGITDVILSCKRNGKSSLDKDLSQRIYNHEFLTYPKEGEILKIICTSKGVMNEMLLSKKFFKLHERVKVDTIKSLSFQNDFVKKIGGKIDFLKKPIFIELMVDNGGIIQCLALPSPGSPFRKLTDFGIDKHNLNLYLINYLSEAFAWFKL